MMIRSQKSYLTKVMNLSKIEYYQSCFIKNIINCQLLLVD